MSLLESEEQRYIKTINNNNKEQGECTVLTGMTTSFCFVVDAEGKGPGHEKIDMHGRFSDVVIFFISVASDSGSLFSKFDNEESVSKSSKHINTSK